MNRRRAGADESGVSLILVLVALTVFGLLVPVLGQFGSVNGVSGYIVKGQRFDRYAADNGMNAAIAYAQGRRTVGRAHVPCPNITSAMNVTSTAFKRDVMVKCQGYAPSGIPEGSDDTPAYAVLALKPTGQHSIDVDSTGRLKTSGAWWANGDAGQTSADIHRVTIDASDDLFGATGGCRPSEGAQIFAAPLRCHSGDPNVDDPRYSLSSQVQSIGDVPVRNLGYDSVNEDPCRAVPANRVLALQPGYYWDQAGLDKIGQGRCGPVVIWLQPGRFYFDLDFYNQSVSDSRWRIGRSSPDAKVVLIGGAPNGWGPGDSVDSVWNRVSTDRAGPGGGACDRNAPGVEMVFGSAAHLEVASPGRAELCPLVVSGNTQHLSIVGRAEGATNQPADFAPSFPSDAVPSGSAFSWPAVFVPHSLDAVECTNNSSCDPQKFVEGTLTGRRRDASVTMTIPNRLPLGSRLDQLSINVVHREPQSRDRSERGDSVAATLANPMSGVDCTGALRLDDRWHSDRVTCTLDRDRAPIPAFANLSLRLDLHNGDGDSENNNNADLVFQVDQVSVEGRSTTPSLRAASSCVRDGGCDLIFGDNSGGSHQAALFVWGTVYAPFGDVHMDYGGSQAFGMERGVVTQQLTLEGLPNDAGFVPVSLPNGGIYSTRTVAFEARIGTKTKLRARVEFADPVKSPDVAPKILSWDTHP